MARGAHISSSTDKLIIMSSSHTPNDDREHLEAKGESGKKDAEPALSFKDVIANLPKDSDASRQDQHTQQKAEEAFYGKSSSDNQSNVNVNRPFTQGIGQRPLFVSRKAEFEHEKPEHLSQLKPLFVQFLKGTTAPQEDEKLSVTDKEELELSRKAIESSQSIQEAYLHAYHLASLYEHLGYSEEAERAKKLADSLSEEEKLGKEVFKELERMHPQDITISAPPQLAPVLSKSNLRKRINALSGGRVLVLGDLLIDEYIEGNPERISREAPVLILEHVETELICGGGANTANNVAALGGSCHAIGIVGRDDYAVRLGKAFEKAGIAHTLVPDHTRPTTVKTRILSKAHSHKQQLLRLDRISHEPIDAGIETLLIDKLQQQANKYQAIVLSDYKCGLMTDTVIRACRKIAQENNLLLIVDAQNHFERFQNVTLITPNQADTEAAVGFEIKDRETLEEAGRDLMLLTGSQALLITRGADGMALFQQGEELFELPAFNRSDVFDVSGAGDTVAATIALCLVTGGNFVEAMALGNLAASIVVKKAGTAVTSQKEMLETLEDLALSE